MTLPEAWCRTYTLLVPAEEAERRRAEVASHVHDARSAGVGRVRLALQSALGAAADLTWIDRVRRRRGLVPLALAPLLDATTGAIVAGALVLLTYAVSTLPGEDPLPLIRTTGYLALLLACSGHVAGLARRRRRR